MIASLTGLVQCNDDGLTARRRPDSIRFGLDDTDSTLFRGDIDHVALFTDDHGAKFETIIERHQAAREADDDGERSGDQQA